MDFWRRRGAETCTRKSKEEKEFGAMVGDGKKKKVVCSSEKFFRLFFSGVEFSGGGGFAGSLYFPL